MTETPITPKQLRQARTALGLSSERLANRSGTTAYGIIKYERFGKVASKRGQTSNFDALASIRAALETAGIELITESDGGAGVRMRKDEGQ